MGAVLTVAAASGLAAADYWVAATDAAVVTNNDCGYVSDVADGAQIKRSFHDKDDPGMQAHAADRLNSGDEIAVPEKGRLEMISGENTILTFGPGSRAKLGGMRGFAGPGGVQTSRLDVVLHAGELRVQVRLNENNSETVLISLNGADVLVVRGDVGMFSGNAWRVAVISGDAQVRLRRGGVAGAAFSISSGEIAGPGTEERMNENDILEMKKRTPFSFELVGAALPPLPPMSTFLEAP